jgi:hypothetical protein
MKYSYCEVSCEVKGGFVIHLGGFDYPWGSELFSNVLLASFKASSESSIP